MAPQSDSSSLSPFIYTINGLLTFVTTAVILLRLYVRGYMIKALGWDDVLAVIALLSVIAVSGLEIAGASRGAGTHMDQLTMEQINEYLALLPITQLVAFLSGGLVRLSILAFLPRLCRDLGYMICVWVTGIAIFTLSMTAFLYCLLQCQPVSNLFDINDLDWTCLVNQSKVRMTWAYCIIGTVLDAVLFVIPIWMVRRTMVFDTKAVRVILIFCAGSLAVIAGTVKTAILMTSDLSEDTTYKVAKLCTCSVVELHVGLWCGSFPALQPLVRIAHWKFRGDEGTTPSDSIRELRMPETTGITDFSKASEASQYTRA